MNQKQRDELYKELTMAGATKAEAAQLTAVAQRFEQLRAPALQTVPPTKRKDWFLKLLPAGATALAGLAVGMFIVVYSQTVLPGSWLYPLQTASDHVAISLDGSYRGAVMMRRAQQVKQLVNAHASTNTVLATLASYQQTAADYQSMSENYAAFEYCKSNLAQAAVWASPTERQAIMNTLSHLKSV